MPDSSAPGAGVALRKESVDRNCGDDLRHAILHVALRKESVDRNNAPALDDLVEQRRSPQGERG